MTRVSIDSGTTWIEWPDTKILLGTNGSSLYGCRLEVEWPSSEPTQPLIPLVGTYVAMVVEVGQSPKVRYFGRALLESVVETGESSRARFIEAPTCKEDQWRRLASEVPA